MKVNINVMALSLFWWVPVYLDLDTGCIYNTRYEASEIEKLKNKRKLPSYSRVPIYQLFLKEKLVNGEIKLGEWFDKYPMFEFIPDYEPEEYNRFMEEAQDSIEQFPHEYSEYLDRFMRRFAENWCIEEGYEWYED